MELANQMYDKTRQLIDALAVSTPKDPQQKVDLLAALQKKREQVEYSQHSFKNAFRVFKPIVAPNKFLDLAGLPVEVGVQRPLVYGTAVREGNYILGGGHYVQEFHKFGEGRNVPELSSRDAEAKGAYFRDLKFTPYAENSRKPRDTANPVEKSPNYFSPYATAEESKALQSGLQALIFGEAGGNFTGTMAAQLKAAMKAHDHVKRVRFELKSLEKSESVQSIAARVERDESGKKVLVVPVAWVKPEGKSSGQYATAPLASWLDAMGSPYQDPQDVIIQKNVRAVYGGSIRKPPVTSLVTPPASSAEDMARYEVENKELLAKYAPNLSGNSNQ